MPCSECSGSPVTIRSISAHTTGATSASPTSRSRCRGTQAGHIHTAYKPDSTHASGRSSPASARRASTGIPRRRCCASSSTAPTINAANGTSWYASSTSRPSTGRVNTMIAAAAPTHCENSTVPSRYVSHTSAPNDSRTIHTITASPACPNGSPRELTRVESGCGVGAKPASKSGAKPCQTSRAQSNA